MDEKKLRCSFFEAITVMAFLYFKEKKVDMGVIEVGIGAKLDATNIIDKKILSIITSIGLDHKELLGETPEEIAVMKSRIIARNSKAVAGPTVPDFVFFPVCKKMNTEGEKIGEKECENLSFYEINEKIAKKAAEMLNLKSVPQQVLQKNLKGRMEEVVFKGKRFVLDVGHNPQAIDYLFRSLKNRYKNEKIVVVFGTSSKKDARKSIEIIKNYTEDLYLISAKNYRAKPIEDLICDANSGFLLIEKGDIGVTLNEVLNRASEKDVVVVCGSFFIMEEARGFLGLEDEKDPFFLNELAGV